MWFILIDRRMLGDDLSLCTFRPQKNIFCFKPADENNDNGNDNDNNHNNHNNNNNNNNNNNEDAY